MPTGNYKRKRSKRLNNKYVRCPRCKKLKDRNKFYPNIRNKSKISVGVLSVLVKQPKSDEKINIIKC